ncbi:hypothetical protein BH10PSE19_BH10PSE19_14150 [soil metagenome]
MFDALIKAVKNNNFAEVLRLQHTPIPRGGESRLPNGKTVLFFSIGSRRLEAKSETAVTSEQASIRTRLLADGVIEQKGISPEDIDRQVIARRLIEMGADRNAQDNKEQTPIIHAIVKHDRVMVRLFNRLDADLHIQDANKKTALFHALEQKDEIVAIELIEAMLRRGQQVRLKESICDTNYLQLAAQLGLAKVVKLLLSYCDVNEPVAYTIDGRRYKVTPLQIASVAPHENVIAQIAMEAKDLNLPLELEYAMAHKTLFSLLLYLRIPPSVINTPVVIYMQPKSRGSLLYAALYHQDVMVFANLLQNPHVNVNAKIELLAKPMSITGAFDGDTVLDLAVVKHYLSNGFSGLRELLGKDLQVETLDRAITRARGLVTAYPAHERRKQEIIDLLEVALEQTLARQKFCDAELKSTVPVAPLPTQLYSAIRSNDYAQFLECVADEKCIEILDSKALAAALCFWISTEELIREPLMIASSVPSSRPIIRAIDEDAKGEAPLLLGEGKEMAVLPVPVAPATADFNLNTFIARIIAVKAFDALVTPTFRGKIPLHYACRSQNKVLISQLLTHLPHTQLTTADADGNLPQDELDRFASDDPRLRFKDKADLFLESLFYLRKKVTEPGGYSDGDYQKRRDIHKQLVITPTARDCVATVEASLPKVNKRYAAILKLAPGWKLKWTLFGGSSANPVLTVEQHQKYSEDYNAFIAARAWTLPTKLLEELRTPLPSAAATALPSGALAAAHSRILTPPPLAAAGAGLPTRADNMTFGELDEEDGVPLKPLGKSVRSTGF